MPELKLIHVSERGPHEMHFGIVELVIISSSCGFGTYSNHADLTLF